MSAPNLRKGATTVTTMDIKKRHANLRKSPANTNPEAVTIPGTEGKGSIMVERE